MNVMSKVLCIFGLAVFCESSFAGDQTGTVTQVYIRASDKVVLIYLSNKHLTPRRNLLVAATDHTARANADLTAAVKRQLAAVLMAQASGKTVVVNGPNTCETTNELSIE